VHVNARFRKPLEPVDVQGASPEPWEAEIERLLCAGPPRVYEPRAEVDPRAIHDLASACARARRGLIVCGPAPALADPALARAAVSALASVTGFPVLAEATSQVRFGGDPMTAPTCGAFDALLRAASFRRDHAPDLILEIGAPPTSAGYAMLLAENPGFPRFVLAPHGWNDPSGLASAMVYADPYDVAARVARELAALARPIASEWARAFTRADARVSALTRRELTEGLLTEGAIVHHLVEALPDGAVLVVGNSMPVRDLDTYAAPSARGLTVLHQRGASGIDGLLSGAAGARSVSTAPMALLLGDLSLLHDLGGLAAARAARRPLLVVVVQNDGGRIFEALPIARRPELEAVLEAHFTTPQGVEFSSAAAMFGLRHRRVETVEALRAGFAEGLASGGCTMVEAVVPPHDAVARRARLYRDVPLALAAPAASEAPGVRGHSAACGAEPQPAEG
jgi:2-succinyl-5-enolpyruvyl-6-hydroxy-3-cyclohexene-1-carboxylate synthase